MYLYKRMNMSKKEILISKTDILYEWFDTLYDIALRQTNVSSVDLFFPACNLIPPQSDCDKKLTNIIELIRNDWKITDISQSSYNLARNQFILLVWNIPIEYVKNILYNKQKK